MRALHVAMIAVAAGGSATAIRLASHAPRSRALADSRGRSGADSARVAAFLTALGRTDPVICDLIGDQLGNFWMGGEPGRLGRFDDAPNVQGAKDSLSSSITDPRAATLLVATLGTDNTCVRRVAAKLLGQSNVPGPVVSGLFPDPPARGRGEPA